MSLDISKDRLSGGIPDQAVSTLNIPLLLILAGTFIGLILVIYVDGVVNAAHAAAQRPAAVQSLPLRRRLRGFPIFLLHRLLKASIISVFPIRGSDVAGCFLLNVAAELLLSNLKVANIHAAITPNSSIPYTRHIFSGTAWSKCFRAALLYSVASSIGFYLPVFLVRLLGVWGGDYGVSEGVQCAIVLFTVVTLYFGAVVPAYATFIRVSASAVGDSPQVPDIKRSWQSFPWSARLQFCKILAEVLVVEIGVSIVLYAFVLLLFHPALHDDVAQFFVKYSG